MSELLEPSEVANNGIDTDVYLEIHQTLLTEAYLIEGLAASNFDHHMWTRVLARQDDLTDAGINAIAGAPQDWLTQEILAERKKSATNRKFI